MSGNVSLYPIFNKRISDNVGYERALIRFYYNNEAGDKELISITDSMHSPEITLNDARNQWYIDKHNLIIEFTLYFEDLTSYLVKKESCQAEGVLVWLLNGHHVNLC